MAKRGRPRKVGRPKGSKTKRGRPTGKYGSYRKAFRFAGLIKLNGKRLAVYVKSQRKRRRRK